MFGSFRQINEASGNKSLAETHKTRHSRLIYSHLLREISLAYTQHPIELGASIHV